MSVLAALEKGVTSVKPTVTAINATLTSFGFTSFKLNTAGDKEEFYEIVRGDGTDARDTLSEGELFRHLPLLLSSRAGRDDGQWRHNGPDSGRSGRVQGHLLPQ